MWFHEVSIILQAWCHPYREKRRFSCIKLTTVFNLQSSSGATYPLLECFSCETANFEYFIQDLNIHNLFEHLHLTNFQIILLLLFCKHGFFWFKCNLRRAKVCFEMCVAFGIGNAKIVGTGRFGMFVYVSVRFVMFRHVSVYFDMFRYPSKLSRHL